LFSHDERDFVATEFVDKFAWKCRIFPERYLSLIFNLFVLTPAIGDQFVGRKDEQKMFEDFLKEQTGGLLILGIRGIGKTSLLYKFKEIAERLGYKTVFISCSSLERRISGIPYGIKVLAEDVKRFGGRFGDIVKLATEI